MEHFLKSYIVVLEIESENSVNCCFIANYRSVKPF